jgi:hypothetical protein
MGYSKTENTVRFARLIVTDNGIKQINKYVNPNETVSVKELK